METDGIMRIWVVGSPQAGKRVLTAALLSTLFHTDVLYHGHRAVIRMLGADSEALEGGARIVAVMRDADKPYPTIEELFRGSVTGTEMDTVELLNEMDKENCGRVRLLNVCGEGDEEERGECAAALLVLDGARIQRGSTDDETALMLETGPLLSTPDLRIIPVIAKGDLLSPEQRRSPLQTAERAYPQLMQMIRDRLPQDKPDLLCTVITNLSDVFEQDGTLREKPDLLPISLTPYFQTLYFAILRTAAPVMHARLKKLLDEASAETRTNIGWFQRGQVRSALYLQRARLRFSRTLLGIGPLAQLLHWLEQAQSRGPQSPAENQEITG